MCHGSDRCGTDSITVLIFPMMAVPSLAMAHIKSPAGVVLTVSFACLYLYDNHNSLPWPGICHGSVRCGADSITVFIFMTITVPYLAYSVSWVWQVWCWHCQYHHLYVHENHSSLPYPIVCHGSDRCGADTVSITVFMFMKIIVPYLAL